jgi:hypothetical protein
MADDFSTYMALLDELQQSSLAALVLPRLSPEEREDLLTRLAELYATVARTAGEAQASALELAEQDLQAASRWFG